MFVEKEKYQQESKTWQGLLYFFKQENALLKTRLSLAVDKRAGKEFLMMAEYFQNQFLLKDEFIRELTSDVREQENFLKEFFTTDKQYNIIKKQDKLRNEISRLEKDFFLLRNEFNKSILPNSVDD